jgi:uncharacterized protein (TIGR03083 family)
MLRDNTDRSSPHGGNTMPDKSEYERLANAERSAIRDALASLEPARWEEPSLCAGWTIRDLAAHMASGDDMTVGRFLATLLAAGFSPDKANKAFMDRWAVREQDEVLEAIGRPGLKGIYRLLPYSALTEAFIHAQDIRRPLGLAPDHSEESLHAVANATCTKQLGTSAKKRIKGLRLRATDIEWSYGEGPEVSGPAEALIMAANGRAVAIPDLSGEGREALAAR